jgi:hypothetical protein
MVGMQLELDVVNPQEIYSSGAVFALFARGAEIISQESRDEITLIISTMLYLIGLGLSDETDITVKGLEIVRKASRVYLEAYTSILLVDKTILVRISTPREILC